MLSGTAENQCAIIRETVTGTVQWEKVYQRKACNTIVINSAETSCYFANNHNSSIGISNVDCTDGSIITYYSASAFKIDNDKFSMALSDTGNTIFMSGTIYNDSTSSGEFYHCRYNTSTPA